ncbi:hypothetical protein [Sphingopyxis flava]|uniref:Uncharacterized protein n=1 Tax=Sphingopyxis flava TaxID=1507287 RepID=A0A1T5FZQ5_9SPHN|nr:hypothetical protein [Sphingopyxis flava]SKC01579.1 hypothetical protein SAMN06295937_10507 [Sphingopyxis flava]
MAKPAISAIRMPALICGMISSYGWSNLGTPYTPSPPYAAIDRRA